MAKLLLLFVLVPAAELALLIEVGGRLGTAATLALIAATGLLGAALANHQGLRTLGAIQAKLAQGELPAGALIDGLIIVVAGALLITPGILTDLVGFLCLVPALRNAAKRRLERRFENALREQRLHVVGGIFHGADVHGPIKDVTPEPPSDPDARLPHRVHETGPC